MKGIYISADKMAALMEWAANSRREAEFGPDTIQARSVRGDNPGTPQKRQ